MNEVVQNNFYSCSEKCQGLFKKMPMVVQKLSMVVQKKGRVVTSDNSCSKIEVLNNHWQYWTTIQSFWTTIFWSTDVFPPIKTLEYAYMMQEDYSSSSSSSSKRQKSSFLNFICFYVDSGATQHMTNVSESFFSTFTKHLRGTSNRPS